MSLTLWTVIAPTPKNKTLGAFTTRHRERMLLQSADDWALRLHSCRALSSTIATRSYNKSFHNEITVDKPHTCNLRILISLKSCSQKRIARPQGNWLPYPSLHLRKSTFICGWLFPPSTPHLIWA